MENHLAEHPGLHPVVPGTGGVRKARWSRDGSGKSGGIRVIYYFLSHRGAIYMLDAYSKAKQADLTPADKKVLKGLTTRINDL